MQGGMGIVVSVTLVNPESLQVYLYRLDWVVIRIPRREWNKITTLGDVIDRVERLMK